MYEDIYTEENIAPENIPDAIEEEFFLSLAKKGLSQKGFTVTGPDDFKAIPGTQMENLLAALKNQHRVLASHYKDKGETIPLLIQLSDVSGASLACVLSLRVKIGQDAFYDPLTGRAGESPNSADYKVALVDVRNAQHVWRNEVYVRSLPNNGEIANIMELLFQDLN